MSKAQPKWTEEREATLISIVGNETPVSPETVAAAAESLGNSTRSISSKLRKMEYKVESTAKSVGKTYTAEEEAELSDFLNSNPQKFTYAELATQVLGGSRTPKQIQGKILSMDLYDLVKATPKKEREKTFTDAEEATLLKLLGQSPVPFIEDIAETMNREVRAVRGKILSLTRTYEDIEIPKQREYKAKKEDAFATLGDVSDMTDEEIAEKIDKSVRGVRTILTHRGVKCKNYDGAKKKASIEEKKSAA